MWNFITRCISSSNEKEKEGKIVVKTKFQLSNIEGNEKIKSINIKNEEGKEIKIETDYILSFFGLIMQLGPISDWGLNMDKKTRALFMQLQHIVKKASDMGRNSSVVEMGRSLLTGQRELLSLSCIDLQV